MHIRTLIAGVVAGILLGVANAPSAHAETNTQTGQAAPEPVIVEVQKGDYLAKIASAHQTTYLRIYYANADIKDPNVIYAGQKFRVPTADEQLVERPLPGAEAPAPVASPQPASAAPKTAPKRTAAPAATVSGGVWDSLAACESGGNWSINTGNGYYGGLQFSLSSWRGVGGSGYPHQASKAEQIARAEQLLARQGWGAWPACSAKLGLR